MYKFIDCDSDSFQFFSYLTFRSVILYVEKSKFLKLLVVVIYRETYKERYKRKNSRREFWRENYTEIITEGELDWDNDSKRIQLRALYLSREWYNMNYIDKEGIPLKVVYEITNKGEQMEKHTGEWHLRQKAQR